MKKRNIPIILVLIILAAVYYFLSGFTPQTSTYIKSNVKVSEDRTVMTFHTDVAASIGHVRTFTDKHKDGKHQLKFYSCWGGFNSTIGAKEEYTLQLDEDDYEICLYVGQKDYLTVLRKDPETGKWKRVFN